MNTKTAPELIEETVQDLDIGFASGAVSSWTIRGEDTFAHVAGEIKIVIQGGETVLINADHVAWYSRRDRTIYRKPTPSSPVPDKVSPAGPAD